MTIPHIVAADSRCQDVNMEMIIMTSVSIYDVTQGELLFLSNCVVI